MNSNHFILLIICLYLATACDELSESQSRRVKEALNDSLLTSTETRDVDMVLYEDGEKKVRITGSYASSYATGGQHETRIAGPVFIQVFDTTGAVTTRVEANRAIYRAEKSEFELFGDVRVRTEDDSKLRSEYLKWDRIENNITTPKFVIITTPTDSIAGSEFTGTTDLKDITIAKPSGRVILD